MFFFFSGTRCRPSKERNKERRKTTSGLNGREWYCEAEKVLGLWGGLEREKKMRMCIEVLQATWLASVGFT